MSKRPVVAVRLSPAGWAGEALAAAGAAAVIVWGIVAWIRLPGIGPTHFGVSGSPDSWGNARATVALLGGSALGTYAIFSVLGRFPHVFNYPW
ncbi:MAG: DUF1648 domain-containing protein, partial [Bacillota bacterium]|nr:DUF1648 domain-containing protein [Bacillota bacterium]